MNPIDSIEAGDLKKGLPRLTSGDTVRVHVRVKESSVKDDKAVGMKGKGVKETERERIQVFEGIVIGLRGNGARATMTVRKVSFGQGSSASSRCIRRSSTRSTCCGRPRCAAPSSTISAI